MHGVRCYVSAATVYEGKGWFRIQDHINFHLGRDCFNLGDFETAVTHFVALIGKRDNVGGKTKEQAVNRQKEFLKELLVVVKVNQPRSLYHKRRGTAG